MIANFVEQAKNMVIKYPEGDRVFVGCYDGYMLGFSMIEKKIVCDLGKIIANAIILMTKTLDNKS